ncbi:MAG: macro domain-containing protein [Kiritimatiellae bacterium]|jgi:O-acetyl-ADP-ribose deacetylase (regulator of RNase III)/uncharacterized protein YwgA|nr:macro domain-containing protein [Kiritimatiellia bacterium]
MKIIVGNILQSKAQTLVNTVNCIGVMGKGIALEFKKKFPEMFDDYLKKCEHGEVKPGVPYIFKTLFPPQIVNFPTKDHWKSASKITDIEKGLNFLLAHYKEWGITSLAIPPLGCGNGQLEWRIVGPLIYKYIRQMDIPVEMFAPYNTNPKELTAEFLEQDVGSPGAKSATPLQYGINPAWVALVDILHRIEQQPYHWPVGRVIFQKIAYVATQEGLPTGFTYQRSSFGPFSKDLKNAQSKLINSNLLQEERVGQKFLIQVGPNFETVRKRYESSLNQWSAIIDKTTDLFMRMNTNQAEVVATVIFATHSLKKNNGKIPTETEALASVMEWKQKRRPPLDKKEVASTIRNLGILHWLDVRPDPNLSVPEEEAILA